MDNMTNVSFAWAGINSVYVHTEKAIIVNVHTLNGNWRGKKIKA